MERMEQTDLVDPIQWIESMREAARDEYADDPTPLIYVAHPVAARPGERIMRCRGCFNIWTMITESPAVCPSCDAHIGNGGMMSNMPADVVKFNVAQARAWWAWLARTLDGAAWTVPWVINVEEWTGRDPKLIERGLRDDCVIVRRCDAIVLCGDRISSGMTREATAGYHAGVSCFHVRSKSGIAAETLWRQWEPTS